MSIGDVPLTMDTATVTAWAPNVDPDQARRFLARLHGHGYGQGDLLLCSRDPETGTWTRPQVACECGLDGVHHPLYDDPVTANLHLLAVDGQRDVYVTANRFQAGRADHWRRLKSDVSWVPSLYADLDLKPGVIENELEMSQVVAAVNQLAKPTMLVDSGSGGYHAYWLLTVPVTHRDQAERLVKTWVLVLNAVASHTLKRPVKLDPMDLSRVLRVPGTVHWPKSSGNSSAPSPVRLLDDTGPYYPVEWFDLTIPQWVEPGTLDRLQRHGVVGSTDCDPDRPSVQAWVRRTLESEARKLAETPEGGHRNPALNRASYTLAGLEHAGLRVEDSHRELMEACRQNGLLARDGQNQCTLTFHSGRDAGLRRPLAPPAGTTDRLTFRSIREMRERRQPVSWLIRGWWTDRDQGVVGGAEKALKSWFLVVMAVAVASGRPFLNVEEFRVPTRRRVLLITGEGGSDLLLDRVEHACKFYGLDVDELEGWLHVADDILVANKPEFRDSLTQAVELWDPGVVMVDPAYVYLSVGDDEAGNVFKMGKLLADLRDLCRGRALVVAHHFRKTVGSEPDLTDLTQAGFREWAAVWVLLWHRETPDVDAQSFKLGVKRGMRRGLGDRHGLDVELGRFDLDALTHVGTPSFSVVEGALVSSGGGRATPAEDVRTVVGTVALLERGEVGGDLGPNVSNIRVRTGINKERTSDALTLATQEGYLSETSGSRNSKHYRVTQLGDDLLSGRGLFDVSAANNLDI